MRGSNRAVMDAMRDGEVLMGSDLVYLGCKLKFSFFTFLVSGFFNSLSILMSVWLPPIDPSWNTDQGVQRDSESVGDKNLFRRSESKNVVGKCNFVDYIMHHRGSEVSLCITRSYHAGTRKIANYACIRWSQKKFWWKSEAILTCKSFVKCGYGGERLIEQSSSWFPPKCPPGQLEHMLKNSFIG